MASLNPSGRYFYNLARAVKEIVADSPRYDHDTEKTLREKY